MKTFKEYYQNEDFKEKHKAYMSEEVRCSCGLMSKRANLTRHKKTETHKQRAEIVDKLNNMKEDELNLILENLQIIKMA